MNWIFLFSYFQVIIIKCWKGDPDENVNFMYCDMICHLHGLSHLWPLNFKQMLVGFRVHHTSFHFCFLSISVLSFCGFSFFFAFCCFHFIFVSVLFFCVFVNFFICVFPSGFVFFAFLICFLCAWRLWPFPTRFLLHMFRTYFFSFFSSTTSSAHLKTLVQQHAQ